MKTETAEKATAQLHSFTFEGSGPAKDLFYQVLCTNYIREGLGGLTYAQMKEYYDTYENKIHKVHSNVRFEMIRALLGKRAYDMRDNLIPMDREGLIQIASLPIQFSIEEGIPDWQNIPSINGGTILRTATAMLNHTLLNGTVHVSSTLPEDATPETLATIRENQSKQYSTKPVCGIAVCDHFRLEDGSEGLRCIMYLNTPALMEGINNNLYGVNCGRHKHRSFGFPTTTRYNDPEPGRNWSEIKPSEGFITEALFRGRNVW